MRISTNLYFTTLNQRLGEQHSKISELQTQLATGKKAVTASMDSEAAMASLRMNSVIEDQNNYKSTLQNVDGQLRQEESLVSAMHKISDRIKELSIIGASDTYSAEDKKMISTEVAQYKLQLLAFANSKDENDNFFFSGSQKSTQPYSIAADGVVSYQGDETAIFVDIGANEKIQVNTIGDEVLGNVTRTAANGSTSKITAFTMLDDFVTALNSNDTENITRAMAEAESFSEVLLKKQVELGMSQNSIANRVDIIDEKTLVYKDLLSNVADTDYSEAITKLSAQMLALEAAQSTFAKVSQLTLFDYI